MLKRGRPRIVRQDERERATGNLSSSTPRGSRCSKKLGLSPSGAAAGAGPQGRAVSGKAARTSLPGAGHAGAQPSVGEGAPLGTGAAALCTGGPSTVWGTEDGQSHSPCSKRGLVPSLPRCRPPAPTGPPGSSPGADSMWRVGGEGDTGHSQSPCTHVPWRGPASELQVVLKTGHLCYIRH